MLHTFKTGAVCAMIGIIVTLAAPRLHAQQPAEPPAAPIPAQLLSAKKVFISNASGAGVTPQGVSELTYNEFYAAMKGWGAYELTSAPADADLVLEIRYEMLTTPASVTNGNGGSGQFEAFQVLVRDPRTQTVLWAFTRGIPGANRQSTGRKNFDVTLSQIVGDLKKLVTPAATTTDNTKK